MVHLMYCSSADWKTFDKGNHTFLFSNVSNVTIANITFPPPPPSIVYEIGCHLSAISNYFYSHNHSAVNISESHALLDNCIFKKNCLLKVEAGSWVSVRDYKFNLLHNILQQMLEGLFMPLFNLTFHAFTSPGIERLLYLNLKTIRKETK